ncbi:MAG: citrate (Si)-synthase [Ignavibacteriales bacterium]|nr:MAG: citrate (Si)-synthase [Ignavibacteriales bacterium]
MSLIAEKLSVKIDEWRKEVSSLVKNNGETKLSDVTISQAYGGMRDVRALICDTSRVPKEVGLIIRGIPLSELEEKTPEEVYYLLMTGELPGQKELEDFSSEIKKRKSVPDYVWNILKAMPADSHPMTMLDTAILVLQKESVFAKEYDKGLRKEDYWKPTLEDSLNLVAKIPAIAAAVYRIRFNKGELIKADPSLDLTGDYVHMLGLDKKGNEFYDLMRYYLVAHSDHEGGNVSALTTQTINSALSDVYYSLSGGFNGLAGPLHGLANQEALKWIEEIMNRFGGVPTHEQLKDLVWETLDAGKVIPGYGHAVLRVTDPRFEGFLKFGKKHIPEDPIFKTVARLYEVVPVELKKISKIKNPWPNVDAASGSLLSYYGLKEYSYYTVVFAVSRSLGLTAQAVVNRALMNPLIRPKSVTTEYVRNLVNS